MTFSFIRYQLCFLMIAGTLTPMLASGVQPMTDNITTEPSSAPQWLKQAQLLEQQQQWVPALAACSTAVAQAPDFVEAKLCQSRLLSRLGLFVEARRAMDGPSGLNGVDPAVIQSLDEDIAAGALRQAEKAYVPTSAERHAMFDNVLRLLGENQQRYPNSVRTQLDTIRALEKREHYAEAIARYELLRRSGDSWSTSTPAYIHSAAGISYMHLRAPNEALDAFNLALARDATNLDAAQGRVNAYADLLDMSSARDALALMKSLKLTAQQRFEADMLDIWLTAYENQTEQARRRFEALQDKAPAADTVEAALGKIALWQDRPHQAQEHFSLLAARDSRDYAAMNGLLQIAISVGDNQRADVELAKMTAAEPGHPDTIAAGKDWQLRRHFEWSTTYTQSNDTSPRANGESRAIETRLALPYLSSQLRPYAALAYEQHLFAGQRAAFRHNEIGLIYQWPWVGNFTVAARESRYTTRHVSPVLQADVRITDTLRIAALFERDSADAPARAHLDDITAQLIRGSLGWRVTPNITMRAFAADLKFTDQNHRKTQGIGLDAAIYNNARLALFASMDAEKTTNTTNTVAYFSPRRQDVIAVGVGANWLTWQRGDLSLQQTIRGAYSHVMQQNFSADYASNFRYEHNWSLGSRGSVNYGLGYVRRVYDGEPSVGPEFSASVSIRF